MYTHLVAWLLVAMHSWGAKPEPAEGSAARALLDERYEMLAADLVAVAFDPDEAPVYQGEGARERTVLLLASIAANESRYDAAIASGHCPVGKCDHGAATGLFQIHAGRYGVALIGGQASVCRERSDGCFTANMLARDPRLQVRVALHILRTQGLAGFCGERGGEGAHARARRVPAEAWYRDHPIEVNASELAAE